MLLLAVMGFLNGRPEFLDLAIVYGLLNVIGTIAVLKFFRYGDLGDPGRTRRGRHMSLWIDALSWICLVAGGFFCIVGALGLVRMPDFYTRMHAASVIETLGAGLHAARPAAAGWPLAGRGEAAVHRRADLLRQSDRHPRAGPGSAWCAASSRCLADRGGRAIETLIIDVLLVLMAVTVWVLARSRNLFARDRPVRASTAF